MNRFYLALAVMLAMTPLAHAQTYQDSGTTFVPGMVPLAGCSAGGHCTGPVSNANPLPVTSSGSTAPSVGAAAIATGQYSNATASATQIVAARTGASGTGRVSVTIYNTGSVSVYVGASGVTTATGIPINPNGSYTLYTTAAVFGVPASGTGTLAYLESF